MTVNFDMIKEIVEKHGHTTVCVKQFFISYNSVATLAFNGFSRTLLAIKAEIETVIPGIKPENPGSKWPKTTLGCLAEKKVLTEKEVHDLRRICREKSNALHHLADSELLIPIDDLSLVTFYCRTLERRLGMQKLNLYGKPELADNPPPSHCLEVDKIMSQFDTNQHDEYFKKLAPGGRTIESYYRKAHIESTLVNDLQPSKLLKNLIKEFQDAVDRKMPDSYVWFEPGSWHMTIRALISL